MDSFEEDKWTENGFLRSLPGPQMHLATARPKKGPRSNSAPQAAKLNHHQAGGENVQKITEAGHT